MNISATIITLNEEDNLPRCLASLEGIVDEIVLVDSFSTDRTLQIAQDHGCQVLTRKFSGYTEQKNFATEHCHYDWILGIDADEVLSEELRSSLLKLKSSPCSEFWAYRFNRLTSYCGEWIRYCGWYPDARIRLWHRHHARWEGEKIHEQVVCDDSAKVKLLSGDLLHYSYNSIDEHISQANKFSSISAEVAFKKNKKADLIKDCILNPLYTFFNKFILRKGFLDGERGFIICVLSAYSNFLKYSKIRMLHEKHRHQQDR